jgi:NADH-quinone oxidoreductase subunit K
MPDDILLQNYLILGILLMALGLIGFLVRRNMIIMFLCAEMMLQGVSLGAIAWGRYHNSWAGQSLMIFVIAVAACEAAIALALVLMLFRQSGSLDAVVWQEMREESQPAYHDERVPEEREEDQVWPTLTPAGRRPADDVERERHRSRV